MGILKGLRQEVGYTLANNTITFLDGYVAIYGRIIYIENQTKVTVTPDSNKFGFVVLQVNTNTNVVSIYTKEASGTYPTLIKNNLLEVNGTYEYELCIH